VSFILAGRGARKGTGGGYNGTLVVHALDAGKTINDSGFQSVSITGPDVPVRVTAWLEDDGSGPNIWRVALEELPIFGGSEATPTFPGDITDLAVVFTMDRNSLTVDFTEATNADSYEYQIALAGSEAWGGAEVLEGSAGAGTFTGLIEGLASNENYDVRVRGVNTNGPGEWSNTATGSTLVYPGEIDDLAVLFTTDTSATLQFTEPDEVVSYEVRFSVTTLESWSTPAALSGSSVGGVFTGAVSSGLTTDETYDFQVRGVNANGEGEWSNTATAVVSDQVPATITDLAVTGATASSATLEFTEPTTPGATSYEVQFSLTGAESWSAPAALSGSSTDGVFTGTVSSGLTENETYDFQVRGVNLSGEAAWSNTATGIIAAWYSVLVSSDLWLTPRTGDGNNTYRFADPDFFLSAANDHSGNARHFTKATEAEQFQRLDTGLNGLPVWGPTAENKGLVGNAAARNLSRNTPALSIVAVVDVPDVTTLNRLFIASIGGSTLTRASVNLSSGNISVNGRRLNGDTFESVTVARAGLTGWGLWVFEFDWAANRARAYRNNTLVLDGAWLNNASAGQNSSDTDSQATSIGQQTFDSVDFWRRPVAELAAFRRILTTQERSDLWTGFGQGIWGLS
jgi:hypothetical protein